MSPTPIPVTAKNALFTYYDIEALNNAFTLSTFTPRTNEVEIFFLVDPEEGSALSEDLAPGGPGIDLMVAGRSILAKNPAYTAGGKSPNIRFWNLNTLVANERLATIFGLSSAEHVNNPSSDSIYPNRFRPVCDTDPGYDPINTHAYLVGYNSFNYDTTMLTLYFMEAFDYVARGVEFIPVKASTMREHNDQLFSKEFIKYMPRYLSQGFVANGEGWGSLVNRIRTAMMNSGRYIDAARLNEAQQMVALKKLLGMIGRQILESDKLRGYNAVIKTMDELIELLAYNVSDCVGLGQLFDDPTYAGAFDLKMALMTEYPETIYAKKSDSYAPDMRPNRIRRGRLTPDSSSAKFVGVILSPYGNLKDSETVSFMYPSEVVAKELGIPRVNVLEESKKFFYDSITDPTARAQFDQVYDYYKSIEGKNYNESEEYAKNYPQGPPVSYLANIPRKPNNLSYFRADGSESSCFATFSTGGIHGAEADFNSLIRDLQEHGNKARMLEIAQYLFPDAKDFVAMAKTQHNTLVLPDGAVVNKALVLLGSDPAKVSYRKPKKDDPTQAQQVAWAMDQLPNPADLLALQRPAEQALFIYLTNGTVLEGKELLANTTAASAKYKEANPKDVPVLFPVQPNGSTKLNGKYTFTSADRAIHEDFTSYYPNMLRNLSAFYNEELGEDRYAKILKDKDLYGQMSKAPGISAEEKNRLTVLRNGTKLILNSASGAGDTTHHTPIRVNNYIISMRIIGQLFSWRVGQAQTLAGARIISTNTDGLYSVLDEETNNKVLAEQQELIHVEIEPEPLLLVSKDSNNRMELEVPEPGVNAWETKIISASGSSLACHRGPNPTKSLAHPAALDHGLAMYLRYIIGEYIPQHRDTPLSLVEPLDRIVGRKILTDAIKNNTPVQAAALFQNIISASSGSLRYPFAAKAFVTGGDPEEILEPRALQHYNRMFIVKEGTPGAVGLRMAGSTKVTAPMIAKRKRDGSSMVALPDPVAAQILRQQGFATNHADAAAHGLTLLPTDQDVSVRKISGIDPTWSVLIVNDDLHCLPPERLQELLDSLDVDNYLNRLAESFEDNWMNDDHRQMAS